MSAVPKFLTVTEAAKAAGLSVRHLNRLVRDGDGPPRDADGTFPEKPLLQWASKRDAVQGSSKAIRDRQAEAKAKLLEMRVAELTGELLRTDDARDCWAGMVTACRSKFLALPAKVAQRIAPPGKVAEVEALVREFIHEALAELAGSGLPPATEARQERAKRAKGGK